MQKRDKRQVIEILCPVYNEYDNIDIFFSTFEKVLGPLKNQYQINYLFMDNCSVDGSFDKIKKLSSQYQYVRGIQYSRNFGVMKSIYTGLYYSRGDVIAVFDCDLQDPADLVLQFVDAWEKGAKAVYGIRSKRDESLIMSLYRKGFKKLERLLKGRKIEMESGAWLLDRCVIEEIRKSGRFEPYLVGLIYRMGFCSVGIPYERTSRKKGVTKFNIAAYFSYAVDGLVSGTVVPLRIAFFVGLCLLAIGSIDALVLVSAAIGAAEIKTISFVMLSQFFGFGSTFVFIGILGEYIGRIYLEREWAEPAIINKIADYEKLSLYNDQMAGSLNGSNNPKVVQ